MAGGIKRKRSFGIIDFPENSRTEDKITRYCPRCGSVLHEGIFAPEWNKEENDYILYDLPKKVPQTLQCYECWEIVTTHQDYSLGLQKEKEKPKK